MKKLFLASLITFGFCTFATAQSAKEIEAKKAAARVETPATTTAVAATPVKAAPSDAALSSTTDVDDAGVVVQNAKTTSKAEAKAEAVKVDANMTDAERKQAAKTATPTLPNRPAKKNNN